MYIKTVYLDGFKSYAKRTEIKGFDREFNAITGLNGTGKSNILDSICFVLGISSLHQVRVSSLQDLIFKSGQAGITKAMVSIVFDNMNKQQSPTGYEQYDELIISRQVEMGGKNKYFINGVTVQNKKVHELFCSVQLNVNNPHFLIMQGRVTKVLNMKPMEILAMIEEAVGIRMYEAKRETCVKLVKKKEDKIAEFNSIIDEELKPQLEKLRKDRNLLLELNAAKQSAHKMNSLYKCFMLHHCKRALAEAENQLNNANSDIDGINANIETNKNRIIELDEEIENAVDKEDEDALNKLVTELKSQEKEQSKEAAAVKGAKQNIASEKKKLSELQKNSEDDAKTLKSKETDLLKLKSLYDELQNNEKLDKAAYDACQKQYEALISGMEINEEGQAETLLAQLANARGCATQIITTIKQAESQLQHRKTQLKEKEPFLVSYKDDYQTQKIMYDNMNKELEQIQGEMGKINYSETEMDELKNSRNILNRDINALREYAHNFTARIPQSDFKYVDPEPNFNRAKVSGVVYTLFEVDPQYYLALETAAGSKLLNVVVDTNQTSKILLERGRLQVRTTIIPVNEIQANPISSNIVDYAKRAVGEDNVDSAMSLIKYDKKLYKAMAYVFGGVLICKDIKVAKTLAFDPNVRRKCVTLGGDVVDPSGVLSGGAAARGGSLLQKLKDFQSKNSDLQTKSQNIGDLDKKIARLVHNSSSWNELKRKMDVKRHDVDLQRKRMEMTKYYELQEEIKNIQQNIVELKEQIKSSHDLEQKNKQKIKDLEEKLQDSDGYKKKELKRVESELGKLKVKAANSENNLKKYAEDFEVIDLEIKELGNGIENIKEQIVVCQESIENLQETYNEQNNVLQGKCENISKLLKEIENERRKLKEKDEQVKIKQKMKEKLSAEISECELEIKKKSHNQKKFQEEFNKAKSREVEYTKNAQQVDQSYMKETENLSEEDGRKIATNLKSTEEKIKSLIRVVNPHAQNMLDQEEKRHASMVKSKGTIEIEKNNLVEVIKDLDHKKLVILQDAVAQISNDFGSIFSTLLPSANCKLQPLFGKSITQGIDIKVALGNIWKESLTELSGGQRSLVALSLILSMLLFKPAPFYILDEIDAALDMSHTQNIGLMIKKHFKKSQFIIVSLKDDMFTNANVLFKTAFIDGASSVLRVVNSSR